MVSQPALRVFETDISALERVPVLTFHSAPTPHRRRRWVDDSITKRLSFIPSAPPAKRAFACRHTAPFGDVNPSSPEGARRIHGFWYRGSGRCDVLSGPVENTIAPALDGAVDVALGHARSRSVLLRVPPRESAVAIQPSIARSTVMWSLDGAAGYQRHAV